MYSEDGACGRRRRIRKATTAAMAITATPPTAPPAIAPVFELPLEGVGVGVGEEDDDNGNGDRVVMVGKVVGFKDGPELGPVGPKPGLVLEAPPPPINWPGPISGLSKTNLDGSGRSKS
jgi:hypothetical protein